MYTPSTGCNKKGIFPLRKLHAYNRVKSKKGEINKQISGKKREERERERERDGEKRFETPYQTIQYISRPSLMSDNGINPNNCTFFNRRHLVQKLMYYNTVDTVPISFTISRA